MLLSHVANSILYFNQANSISSPPPSHGFVSHPLILAPRLGRRIPRPPAKAITGAIAQRCSVLVSQQAGLPEVEQSYHSAQTSHVLFSPITKRISKYVSGSHGSNRTLGSRLSKTPSLHLQCLYILERPSLSGPSQAIEYGTPCGRSSRYFLPSSICGPCGEEKNDAMSVERGRKAILLRCQ